MTGISSTTATEPFTFEEQQLIGLIEQPTPDLEIVFTILSSSKNRLFPHSQAYRQFLAALAVRRIDYDKYHFYGKILLLFRETIGLPTDILPNNVTISNKTNKSISCPAELIRGNGYFDIQLCFHFHKELSDPPSSEGNYRISIPLSDHGIRLFGNYIYKNTLDDKISVPYLNDLLIFAKMIQDQALIDKTSKGLEAAGFRKEDIANGLVIQIFARNYFKEKQIPVLEQERGFTMSLHCFLSLVQQPKEKMLPLFIASQIDELTVDEILPTTELHLPKGYHHVIRRISFTNDRLFIWQTAESLLTLFPFACISQTDSFIAKLKREAEISQESGALRVLGNMLLQEGLPDECIQTLVKVKEHNGRSCVILGEAYRMTKQHEKAMTWLYEARKYTPACPLIFICRGDLLKQEGNYKDASTLLETAAAIDPKSAHTQASYGDLLVEQHEFLAAEPFLLKALRINPYLISAYKSLIEVYEKQGRIEEAKAALAIATELNNNKSR
jgi:hypothetical protein